MHDQDIVREFLVESDENLSRLDQDLVELERHPQDAALLASIFRTIHTIKGTCGFLAFGTLEKINHHAENLLSQLRDRRRELNPVVGSLILETVDATRKVLASIEASGEEGPDRFEGLVERLRSAAAMPAATAAARVDTPADHSMSEPAESKKDEEDAARPSSVADANIRVGVGLLDRLMDLVGERNACSLQDNAERRRARRRSWVGFSS